MIFMLAKFSFAKYLTAIFIAVLPFIEAKGAIPIGLGIGLSPTESFCCSYLGSMLPVPILLTLIIPTLEYLNKKTKFKKFSSKIINYINKKTVKMEGVASDSSEYKKPFKLMTLFTFVAIPFPGTGVWSGSLIAAMLNVNKKQAFFIIAFANLFASSLIFMVSMGVIN